MGEPFEILRSARLNIYYNHSRDRDNNENMEGPCRSVLFVNDDYGLDVKDDNDDTKICLAKAIRWVIGRYDERVLKAVFNPIFSECRTTIDVNYYTTLLRGLRENAMYDTRLISSKFGNDADRVAKKISKAILTSEKGDMAILTSINERGSGSLGMIFKPNTGLIVSVKPGSSAEAVGVKTGDVIVSVDGIKYLQSSTFWDTFDEIAPLLKGMVTLLGYAGKNIRSQFFGACGSKAELVVRRGEEELKFNIERQLIPPTSVDHLFR